MKMVASNSDSAKLLLVEDDRKLCELVKTYLKRFGYAISSD